MTYSRRQMEICPSDVCKALLGLSTCEKTLPYQWGVCWVKCRIFYGEGDPFYPLVVQFFHPAFSIPWLVCLGHMQTVCLGCIVTPLLVYIWRAVDAPFWALPLCMSMADMPPQSQWYGWCCSKMAKSTISPVLWGLQMASLHIAGIHACIPSLCPPVGACQRACRTPDCCGQKCNAFLSLPCGTTKPDLLLTS